MSQSDQSVEILEPAGIDVLSISSDMRISSDAPGGGNDDQQQRQEQQAVAHCRRTLQLHWTNSPDSAELDNDPCAGSGYAAFRNACIRQQVSCADTAARGVWRKMMPRERLAFQAETFVGHVMMHESSTDNSSLSERWIRQYFRDINTQPDHTR